VSATQETEKPLVYHPSRVSWATAKFIGAPPAFAARLFFYSILLLLAAGTVYAYFARVAVVVEAPGIITPEGGVLPINSPVTFTVKDLLVSNGQTVAKDQLLVVSEDNLTDEEATKLLDERRAILDLVARDERGGCPSCATELEALAAKAFAVDGGGPIRERLLMLRQQLRELASARSLFERRGSSTAGLRRVIEVAQSKLDEISKRGANELLSSRVEQLTSEIVAAKSQLADREKGERGMLDQARIRLTTQLGELEAEVERYRAQQTIAAPVAGTVIDLSVSGAGQRIAAGQLVLQLVPEDAVLAAQVKVANKDISKVKPGMEVRLELAALPVREYGAVTGEVLSISPNAKFDTTPGSGKSPQPVYEVMVRLSQKGVTKDGREYPFRMGMSLRGLIVSKYESMLSLAVKRLLDLKDEIVQEY
jgi:hemolysin D